jgi:selenide,water dikinase
VVGGHSVKAPETTYGLAVTGRIRSGERYFANAGAQVGDALVLTKPLGTGILATAIKKDVIAPADRDALIASLTRLNAHAGRCLQRDAVHAATDITGFALVGHGAELASASGVTLAIDTTALPLLPGVAAAVAATCITRGDASNRAYAGDRLRIADGLDPVRVHAAVDPQSSGGLLIAVAADAADALLRDLHAGGDPAAAVIGRVEAGPAAIVLR